VDRLRPSRVVFDSLSELKLLARDPLRYRRQILALKEFFSGRACTVVLLDDLSAGGGDLQLESLAHGVIVLETLPFEYGRARRRLRVTKLRGGQRGRGVSRLCHPQRRPGGIPAAPYHPRIADASGRQCAQRREGTG
jgi:KaiC/GvpD/RAD55 family RecA-like ATPase